MSKKAQIIAASVVWLGIFLIAGVIWKLLIVPYREQAAKIEKDQQHQQTIVKTSAESRYHTQINFAYDSFSGYCVFRSDEFLNELSHKRIKLVPNDDGANYTERLKSVKDGKTQIAVFTIDALIKASSELGDLPATIVAVVDETRGADAAVAYKDAVPNIDVLNDPDVKFILTPDSPSETLSRVVISHFGLRTLNDKLASNDKSQQPFVAMKDAEAVYRDYRASKQTDKKVFVLWEPYVTKMLENPNTHVLVDSSRFRGYIVDVIVVNREYLANNSDKVSDFVEAYFRASFTHNKNMAKLIAEDAIKSGQPLSEKQIERLTAGILWKNTSENYAHFGLNGDQPLQHVEDMILNITQVLLTTHAIKQDPTNGKPNLLYVPTVLAKLQTNNFHPGIVAETIRKDNDTLPALTEEEWTKLIPVGTLDVPPLVFARGTDRITEQSQITLNDLIAKLNSWPQYYILVRGNASLQGDLDANKALANSRAVAVENYLLENGISKIRVKTVAVEPSGTSSVVFQLGYVPY